jgi:signal transduction histidine kinase
MHGNFINRLLLPSILGLIAVTCVLILWQRLLTKQRADIQTETKARALFVRNKMESELRESTLPLELLGERWQVRSKYNRAGLESDVSLVMSRYPAFQAIAWVNPTFNAEWVSPRQEKEGSVDEDLWTNTRTRTALQAAEESGRVVVTHPINSKNGDLHLLLCAPVYSEDKLDGFLVGVLDYQELFDSTLREVTQDYWVAVYDDNQEIYPRTGTRLQGENSWAEQADIEFRQRTWQVKIWPKNKTLLNSRSPLPRVTFVGGILLAGLLAFAVYMAEATHLQSQKVESTNKELQREITNREQTEEALRQAQKMEAVGRLAGGVAHNFNNLLMVIRGHAALSLNRLGSDHPLRQALHEIVKTTDRASSLTRQLLAFSRKQTLHLQVLDLNALVIQMTELLPAVLGTDIRLVLDLAPQLGRVKTDAGEMEQVIMNLVFNARDAMPTGGDLKISTANTQLDDAWVRRFPAVRPGPHVVLAVSDTGSGMDENTQARMFDPFFTTKEKDKGTGLGLSTVYGTVNNSGGCIAVASEPGKGTTLQIYLPCVEEFMQTIEPVEEMPGAAQGQETILVVEDDDAVRHMTREFLTIKGYTVKEARNGAEAIEFLGNDPGTIELVVTDVSMPGIKGREFGECLAQLRTGIKILYMSAHSEDFIIDHDMLLPGTPFIEKPFSPEELASKVKQMLISKEGEFAPGPWHRGKQTSPSG